MIKSDLRSIDSASFVAYFQQHNDSGKPATGGRDD